MSPTRRIFLRLRDRAVRCYELLLYALLLSLGLGVVFAAAEAADDPVQCGNIHSSSGVMTR